MTAFDYKKEFKDLYQPATKPGIIDVPEMVFIMIDGRGDPNTSVEYAHAVEMLYGLTYTIKMSKMGGNQPAGYFEYVVPPLEGLWEVDDGTFTGGGMVIADKNRLRWTSMIRQPEFVTPEVFEWAKPVLKGKKPALDTSVARLVKFAEGLCAQVMHIGPYDDEPATVAALEQFIVASGYKNDIPGRRHHEIYLSDPRKTAPEKMKTIIRHPITK
jgi:hypothetical protein